MTPPFVSCPPEVGREAGLTFFICLKMRDEASGRSALPCLFLFLLDLIMKIAYNKFVSSTIDKLDIENSTGRTEKASFIQGRGELKSAKCVSWFYIS
jgi:hypothetical protein